MTTEQSVMGAALDAAARGWHVFPLRGKLPVGRWQEQATTDAQAIVVHLAGTDCNYGIWCGPSGLVVIDEDDPDRGGLSGYADTFGKKVPDTYTVLTREGRKHFYFRAPHGTKIDNSPGMLKDFGCDVRGYGGYVVGAGSVHPATGDVYTPVDPSAPVAAMPGWLVDAVTRRRPVPGDGGVFGPDGFVLPDVIPAGKRDETLFHYACSMRARGLTVTTALERMREAWARCEQPPQDRYPVAQALAKIDHAWAKYEGPPLPVVANGGRVANADASSGDDAAAGWLVDLGPYLDGTYEPEVPVMFKRADGVCLVYAGKIHWFHGESESGKSLILQACLVIPAIMAGRDVLYLDFEDSPRPIIDRLVLFGASVEAIRAHFHYAKPDMSIAANPGAWAALFRRRYAAVIFDAMTDALGVLTGGSSNSADDVARFDREALKPWAATGAAVAVIDHPVKNKDARGGWASGTERKKDLVSGAAYVVEAKTPLARGKRSEVTLRISKDRPGYVRENSPAPKPGRLTLAARVTVDSTNKESPLVTVEVPGDDGAEPSGNGFRYTALMERASVVLERLARDETLTRNKLVEQMHAKEAHCAAAIDTLVDEGYVRRGRGPNNSYTHALVKPYRQENDPECDRYLPAFGPGGTQ